MGNLDPYTSLERVSLEARQRTVASFTDDLHRYRTRGSYRFDMKNVDVVYANAFGLSGEFNSNLTQKFAELKQIRDSELEPSDKAFMGIEPVNIILTGFIADNDGARVQMVFFEGTITHQHLFGLYDPDNGTIVVMTVEDIAKNYAMLRAIARALIDHDDTLVEELTSVNPDGSPKQARLRTL